MRNDLALEIIEKSQRPSRIHWRLMVYAWGSFSLAWREVANTPAGNVSIRIADSDHIGRRQFAARENIEQMLRADDDVEQRGGIKHVKGVEGLGRSWRSGRSYDGDFEGIANRRRRHMINVASAPI